MRQKNVGTMATVLVASGLLALASTPAAEQAAPAGRQGGVAPAPAAGPRGGGRGPAGRKRVLAWADTRNGVAQHDSVSHALALIERMGYDSGLWDTLIRTDSNIVSAAPKRTDGTAASGGP